MITLGPTFASLGAESFDPIRGSADDRVAVRLRLLDALQTSARFTTSGNRRQVLREQMDCTVEAAARTLKGGIAPSWRCSKV